MEEAGLRIEDIPVIISATQVMLRLIVLAQLLGDLRQAPLVVSRPQSDSDRLAFLPDRDIRDGLLLARAQSRDIAMLLIEIIQPAGGLVRPRDQGLLLDTFPAGDVGLVQVKAMKPLAISVDHGRHRMIGVHASRIACHLREGRHPVRAHLLGHQEIRVDNIRLQLGVDQYPQRMRRPISIPNPIVRIERLAAIIMNLAIERAIITSILAQADRPLKTTVKRGIEYRLIRLRATLNRDLAQSDVPFVTRLLGSDVHIITRDLAIQVLLGLLLINERDAVAHAYRLHLRSKSQSDGRLLTFDRSL